MQLVRNFQFGSDVEFFVSDNKGNIASAEGFIPGTKKEPKLFVTGNKYFATQLDNVLAEGNIPPTADVEEFVAHMMQLRKHIDDTLVPHGLVTVAQAAAQVPSEFLQTENAKTFGCDESYNCWTQLVEEVTPGNDPNLRTAGFHIHIGYDDPSPEVNIAIARALDLSVGVSSVLYEPPNDRRRLGYGRAGNFRHQPHGVEYRMLSSWWASADQNIRWVLDTIDKNVMPMLNHKDSIKYIGAMKAFAVEAQDVINNWDKAAATKLIARMRQALPCFPYKSPGHFLRSY